MSRTYKISLAAPYINEKIESEVLSVIRSGWLVAGPKVDAFEQKLCEITGRKHAVAVSSGTGALLSAMVAMGIGPGSTVIVPAFTFPAPASAAAFLGASIRLCDVDAHTMNISVASLKAVLEERVSLVVGIDQFGNPCPASDLAAVCEDAGVPLLVDAACSIGATLYERPCGAFGDASILSFHPRKIVTTAEGGAVLTDNDEIATEVRRFRNIGLEDGVFKKVGFNLRPSEMGAAMGRVQLDLLDDLIARRRELAELYAALPLGFQQPISDARMNYQTLAAVLPMTKRDGTPFGVDIRSDFLTFLADRGIQAQVASYHLARIDWLVRQERVRPEDTPICSRLHDFGIALPMHCGLTDDDVKEVVDVCLDWLEQRSADV
ncbi:MAG: DegT/DnrJ/EryC1/StrS aminotransferase family protein [Deltaproteobacteria bacterium]|nr:DegT/DnrJ/EryC1/StrS aminotransferase family protein [Deltaproteobacteria bacterium]MBN2673052.1 DegT/DnrJ/EryC1/StrS aminotransferase family protein [Deltaproteobacteria bacterium]